jgi:PAS domain S-box-containing protein
MCFCSKRELLHKNGSPVWFLVSAKASFDDAGKFAGSLGMFTDITDRKRAEQELRESKARVGSIFRSAPVGIGVVVDRIIKEVNERLCEMTGYSREELMGKSALMLYPTAEEYERVGSVKYDMITERGTGYVETHWQRKDGSVVDILLSSSPIIKGDLSGEITFTALDITDRKRVEEVLKKAHDNLEKLVEERTLKLEKACTSLKESEKGLAEAQKMAHIGSWVWDRATDKAYWSDELYRIFGRNPQEQGAPYNEFLNYIHPDDRAYMDNAHKKALNGKPYNIEYRIVLVNGEERTVHMQSEVIFDEKNIPIQLKGIVQDITERKKAEEKLLESEEKYRNIVETANEGINLINNEGVITYTNNKMADMLGYPVEEIVGRTIWDFVNEEDKPTVTKSFVKRCQGILESYEMKLIRKDGSLLMVGINSKPIFDDNSKFIGILTMHTDITKRKEAEEALANIEITRKKEIHHRIKNNLQVISSLLDLQADKFNDTKVIEAFRESQNRVISMALIHEELYKEEGTDTLNFSEYLKMLANNLFQTYILSVESILKCRIKTR